MRPPIGKALAGDALQGQIRAFVIVQLAGVVAEVELCGVAAKVRFAKVVVGANHAALEDRKEVFDRVAVLEAARSDVFAGAVVYAAVTAKFAAKAGIDRAFIGHKVGAAMHVGNDQGAQGLSVDVSNVEAADFTITLDKGDNGFLRGRLPAGAVLSLAADIGFIGFDNGLIATAKRGRIGRGHSFTNTVHHKPSGLVGDAQHTGDLMAADTLL